MIFNPAFYGNAGPSASGTVTISQNSFGLDIASYASADVIVPMSGAIDWDYIDANQYRDNESITGITSNAKFIFPCAFCMSSDYERWSMSYANFSECLYIGGRAFESRTRLTSISFPQCEIIDYGAFNHCWRITAADFPKTRYVGTYAFNGCASVSYMNFPECQYVDSYAFNGCQRLASVDLPNCLSVSTGAFQGCGIANTPFTINLPMCSTIGPAAFPACTTLSQITLPECKIITRDAFNGCRGLVSASFSKVWRIAEMAFSGCTNLTYVSCPCVDEIFSSAFTGCNLQGTVEFPALRTLPGSYVFANNSSMTKFSAPVLGWMSELEFVGCTSLTEAYMPLAYAIGASAFRSCTALTSLTLADSPTTSLGRIGAYAFTNTGLYSFVNADGPTFVIGSYAFASCRNLSYVYYRTYGTSNASYSMMYAFRDCSNLQSVHIVYINAATYPYPSWSSSNVGVGYGAFSGCTNLRNVTLIGIRYISMFAFTYCSSLTLRIDGILPEIMFSTFTSCSLQSIYIASSLYSQIMSSYWWWNSYSTIIMSY